MHQHALEHVVLVVLVVESGRLRAEGVDSYGGWQANARNDEGRQVGALLTGLVISLASVK